jgi:diadenosine tetraphosphate (Ap4A) HIT family hydrolase
MPNCIFCNILAGQAPAQFVYQDELCVAFMDIHPVNPGHVLVVPRQHAAELTELDEASTGRMMQVGLRVDRALRASGIKCEGVNLFMSDGRTAGQEVMHIHLHIVPRFHGDGHQVRIRPKTFPQPTSSELSHEAELIRANMGDQS